MDDVAGEVGEWLRGRVERMREQQAAALAVTGSATSRDGSVKVVVDATGVVTSMEFAPGAVERGGGLDKLARTAVATIQEAATRARTRMSEAAAALRSDDDPPVLAAAADGTARLGLPRVGVPEVPRTAVDESGLADWPEPARGPVRRRTGDDDLDEPVSHLNSGGGGR